MQVYMRRAAGVRRCYHRNEEEATIIKEIYDKYAEPATNNDLKQEKRMTEMGPPAFKERAKIRKQCKAHGPIGLLLESMRL